MGIVGLKANAQWPGDMLLGGGSDTLDAAEELTCRVLQVPKTGTLKAVWWRGSASTWTGTMRVCLETVAEAVGAPVATTYAGKTLYTANAESADVTSVASGVNVTAINGSTGVSVTRGDLLSVVWRMTARSAGSVSVTPKLGSGGSLNGPPNPGATALPYGYSYLNSTGAVASALGVLALEYSDELVMPDFHLPPYDASASESYSNASNPNRRGMKFRLPLTMQAQGVAFGIDSDGDYDVELYEADEYTLVSGFPISVKGAKRRANTLLGTYVLFPSAVTLVANTWYRLVIAPSSATAVSTYYVDFSTTSGSFSNMGALPAGEDCIYTTFNGTPTSGSHVWTDTATRRFVGALLIDGIDIPTDAEVAAAVWGYANRTLTG